jgi:hypothetical protein
MSVDVPFRLGLQAHTVLGSWFEGAEGYLPYQVLGIRVRNRGPQP